MSIPACIEKVIYYMRAVALEDIHILYYQQNKKEVWDMLYPKYDNIKFGPSFFRDFPCLVCGRCCHKDFYHIYSESDYKKNEQKPNDTINVNNKIIPVHIKDYEKNRECSMLIEDDKGVKRFCSVHDSQMITCHAPHRAPHVIDGKCSWVKRGYGRNCLKKPEKQCPGKPKKDYSIEEIDGDIRFFEHLKRVCEDFKIKHCCDDLLSELNSIKNSILREKRGRMF